MSLNKSCRVQRVCAVRGPLMVLIPALMAGGCGHQNYNQQAGWYAGGPRQTAAVVPIPVDMEDDGRPAQLPPRADVRQTADDPTQPWSPNYGGPATRPAVKQAPNTDTPVPKQAPPSRHMAWATDEN